MIRPVIAATVPVGLDRRAPECVALEGLFESRLVRVTSWRCLRDGEALRADRYFTDPVLTLAHSGASICHFERREILVDPTRVFLRNPRETYRTTHPFGCGDTGVNVRVRPDLVREAIARYDPLVRRGRREPRFPAPFAPAPPRAIAIQRVLLGRLQRGLAVDPLAVEECLLRLFDESVAAAHGLRAEHVPSADEETDKDRSRWVEATQEILLSHFRETIQLDDVATAVGVSPFHLSRVFRRATGLPIHRYLTRLRLHAALERVNGEREADLTRLAYELGFSSHSHFTSAFRREFGMTPSTVRRLASRATLDGCREALSLR